MFYQISGTHASAFDSLDIVKFLVENDFFNHLSNEQFINLMYETASYYEALKTLSYLQGKSQDTESAIISAIENFSENSLCYFLTETNFQITNNILNSIFSQPHKKELISFLEKLALKQTLDIDLKKKVEDFKILKV